MKPVAAASVVFQVTRRLKASKASRDEPSTMQATQGEITISSYGQAERSVKDLLQGHSPKSLGTLSLQGVLPKYEHYFRRLQRLQEEDVAMYSSSRTSTNPESFGYEEQNS